ncbi:MAG: carboxypeptidase regulatory-like domain-containing protein, partial [Bryobacterales bacterium]|nr:carboxypeptidase regulatory-like domain-containing protein [Bryobacterales bacterium]
MMTSVRLLSAMAIFAAVAFSQVSTGTLNVVADDATGAVVTNAQVTITNKNTGQARTGVTDGRGEFQATFLPAGEYSISVESAGFKKSTI